MKSNKYRVWDTAHEAFIDDVLLAQDGTFLLNSGNGYVPSLEPERYIAEFVTGYLDKSGQEIYEGDIVKAEWHWNEPHVIVWPDDQYDFLEYSIDSGANPEVIGNIRENSDLIP